MSIQRGYLSLIVLVVLVYLLGNFIFGPLGLAASAIFVVGSLLQAKRLMIANRKFEAVFALCASISMLASISLPIWGYHPSIGVDANGKPWEAHAHFIWQVDHVH